MDVLAETNAASPGRWVLVPRKGHRFLGPRDRNRARLRRRRRLIVTVLSELTLLTLIIGLFPPLRSMLLATAVFASLLVVYVAALANVRAQAARKAREIQRLRPLAPPEDDSSAASVRYIGAGPGRSVPPSSRRLHAPHAQAARTRHPSVKSTMQAQSSEFTTSDHINERDYLLESGVRVIGDDVHVVVHKADGGDAAGRRRELAESAAR